MDRSTFGHFGDRLSSARQTEFFHWFCLQECERRHECDATVVRFRPEGDAFRALVRLDVTIDDGERLRGLELEVARSFLADLRQRPFADDLIRSFRTTGGDRAHESAGEDGHLIVRLEPSSKRRWPDVGRYFAAAVLGAVALAGVPSIPLSAQDTFNVNDGGATGSGAASDVGPGFSPGFGGGDARKAPVSNYGTVVGLAAGVQQYIVQVAEQGGAHDPGAIAAFNQRVDALRTAQTQLPPDQPRPARCYDTLVGAWVSAQQGRAADANARSQTAMDCYRAMAGTAADPCATPPPQLQPPPGRTRMRRIAAAERVIAQAPDCGKRIPGHVEVGMPGTAPTYAAYPQWTPPPPARKPHPKPKPTPLAARRPAVAPARPPVALSAQQDANAPPCLWYRWAHRIANQISNNWDRRNAPWLGVPDVVIHYRVSVVRGAYSVTIFNVENADSPLATSARAAVLGLNRQQSVLAFPPGPTVTPDPTVRTARFSVDDTKAVTYDPHNPCPPGTN